MRGATYGRTSDNPISLWKVEDALAKGTIATFVDSDYRGDHAANPANPANVEQYYFNDNLNHFRVSNAGVNGWSNLPVGTRNSINDYLPTDHVWILGDGSDENEGVFPTDQDALNYLETTIVLALETYVFFGVDSDELRTIVGSTFTEAGAVWVGVSSGTGPVPGPIGRKGEAGSNGSDGTDGSDGQDGSNGSNGSDGSDGSTGSVGPTGTPGTPGGQGTATPPTIVC